MGSQLLLFAVLGLGAGVVYAGLGLGLVVTYRGTGVVNLAQGAVAMWGAYVYDGMRTNGRLYLPMVGLPHSIDLSGPTGAPVAVLAGVLSSTAVGLLSYLLVFRPLRHAPQLARVVASVGITTILQALATAEFGSQQQVVPPFLSSGSLGIAGQRVPVDRFEALAVAVVVTAGLYSYFRFTRAGLATAAVAESERSVSLLGYSPDRLALIAWALSGASAGVFGVLIAPMVQLNTINYTLFIVPALAVALVGRFRSVPMTAGAGILLGVAQSILGYLKGDAWFPTWAQVGIEDALPLVIIVLALFFTARRLSTRGDPATDKLPRVRRPRSVLPVLGIILVVGLVSLLTLDGTYRFGFVQSTIAALLMLSFVVLTGYAGQISLAQVAIAGTAGLAMARFSVSAHVPFPVAPLLGAATATLLGLVVALPALRVRGIQLAVVTLAFAVAIESFVFGNPSLNPTNLPNLTAPRLFGFDLSVRSGADIARIPFGGLSLVMLLLAVVAVANLARGGTGLRMLAVRSNERVAASAGIGVTGTKLLAFAIASFLAGLAGALSVYSLGQFSAASFNTLSVGLPFLAFAYLGGITSISGALVAALLCPGGVLYVVLNNYINHMGPYYLLISGIGLVLTAVSYPDGIVGTLAERLRPLLTRTDPLAAAAQVAPSGRTGRVRRPDGLGLQVLDLTVDYGGVRAVDHASLTVGRGEVVGLIGPNGAGKTSLIDAISGFTQHRGSVSLDGESITGWPAHRITRRGLTRTWQNPDLFTDLTVAENLIVAGAVERPLVAASRDLFRPTHAAALDVGATLDLLGLSDVAGAAPDELSLGRQKLVGVARAIIATPSVVLLDEPAAGLDGSESALLGRRLRELADSGIGLLLVDHDMDLVFSICDRIVVLEFGRVIAEGTPAQVRSNPIVLAAYLGADNAEPALPAFELR